MLSASSFKLNADSTFLFSPLPSFTPLKQRSVSRFLQWSFKSVGGLHPSFSERSLEAHVAAPVEPVTVTEKEQKRYSWLKHWWPVQFVYNLDDDRPNRVELMGEFFVVWKSPSGKWVTMKDMCPHRLAPLSEGRIEEDGTLMCSYHGWRFNDCGKCMKIPQADDARAHETACNNPRSIAKTFPCQVSANILWIWPDSSESAFAEAESSSTGLPDSYTKYHDKQLLEGYVSNFYAELPYDYEVLVENLLDPSHVPFAHHGNRGTDRADGGPLHMKFVDALLPNSDAVAYTDHDGNKHLEFADKRFAWVEYETSNPDVSNFGVVFLATPIRDGRSSMMMISVPSGALSGNEKSSFMFNLLRRRFAWVMHLGILTFVYSDNVFLHGQDKHLRDLDGWHQQLYFTPTTSDQMVINARSWMSEGSGGDRFAGAQNGKSMSLSNRRELLDRYQPHVSKCKACQKGLRFVNRLSSVFKLLSRGALFVGCAMTLSLMQQGPVRIWLAVVTALVCAISTFFEHLIREKILPYFYFIDCVHAEKN